MAYADYQYYKNTYLGTAIQETDFPRLALRASSFLDYYTQGRAAKNPDMEALKMACCALAEQFQTVDAAHKMAQKALSSSQGGAEPQSQSVGSWSKTYRSAGDSAKQATEAAQLAQGTLFVVAQKYLAHTGLLYRGRGCACGYVPPCCDGL